MGGGGLEDFVDKGGGGRGSQMVDHKKLRIDVNFELKL